MIVARFAVPLVALWLAFAARPAYAACARVCDDEYEYLGGSGGGPEPARHDVGSGQMPQHRRVKATEATPLSALVWSKLRARAHDYLDETAYALIKATAKLALVVAATEHDAAAAGTHDARPPECPSERAARAAKPPPA